MQTATLSEAAAAILSRRLDGERVELTEASRPGYEELEQAGLMEALHTFSNGPRGHFRLTEKAVNGRASRVPFAGAIPARGG